jgi:hypothetical protein
VRGPHADDEVLAEMPSAVPVPGAQPGPIAGFRFIRAADRAAAAPARRGARAKKTSSMAAGVERPRE